MIEALYDQEKLVLKFPEHLDTETCAGLEKEIKEQLDGKNPKKIVFDLYRTKYVASAFLRICISMEKKSPNKFAIINASEQVKKIFNISGLEKFLDIS